MFFFHRNTIQHPGENVPYEEQVRKLKEKMQNAEAIVLGAGSGLSTAAGLTYSGERFQKYFFDFAKKYPIRDIYSGGFFPFEIVVSRVSLKRSARTCKSLPSISSAQRSSKMDGEGSYTHDLEGLIPGKWSR